MTACPQLLPSDDPCPAREQCVASRDTSRRVRPFQVTRGDRPTPRELPAVAPRSAAEPSEGVATLAQLRMHEEATRTVLHDLANLVGGVGVSLELMLEDLPETCPRLGDTRDAALVASEAVAVARAALDLAGRRPGPTRFDLGQEIHATVRLLNALLRRRPPVVLDIHETSELQGDVVLLRQAIQNIVFNARDAVQERGVEVPIAILVGRGRTPLADAGRVLVDALPPGAEVAVVRVRDGGAGMASGTLARIGDTGFTTKSTGHGYGLAGVIQIVRSLGGALAVESTQGYGSTFTVYLPTAPDRMPAG